MDDENDLPRVHKRFPDKCASVSQVKTPEERTRKLMRITKADQRNRNGQLAETKRNCDASGNQVTRAQRMSDYATLLQKMYALADEVLEERMRMMEDGRAQGMEGVDVLAKMVKVLPLLQQAEDARSGKIGTRDLKDLTTEQLRNLVARTDAQAKKLLGAHLARPEDGEPQMPTDLPIEPPNE